MTDTDQVRLAQIRASNEQWMAGSKEWVGTWDTTFLIQKIDELLAEKKN